MKPDFEALNVIAQVGIGYVGFATIVAILWHAYGKGLGKFQILLFHFFVETGLLMVWLALWPIILWQVFQDALTVYRLEIYTLIAVFGIYLLTYMIRRARISAPTPLTSAFVMVGFGITLVVLIVTATEIYWQPSMGIITLSLLWGFTGNAIIFVYFMASFIGGVDPIELHRQRVRRQKRYLFVATPFLGFLIATYVVIGYAQADMAAWLAEPSDISQYFPFLRDEAIVSSKGNMMIVIGLVLVGIDALKFRMAKGWRFSRHAPPLLIAGISVWLLLSVETFETPTFFVLTLLAVLTVPISIVARPVTPKISVHTDPNPVELAEQSD